MYASYTPAQARELFRTTDVATTAGFSAGYAQANLIALDRKYAFDFLLFAQRNPKPCPLLGVLEPGQVSSPLLAGGDIRTDIPSYRVFSHGSLIDEPTDATAYWTENTVAFVIGCSFTFEQALLDNNVPVAHIEQGVNVPMFMTNIDCEPAGVFSGKMVVSMRPIPAGLVADAVRITSRYPAVHGAPVHVGEPGLIGIEDLSAPDFGEAVDIPAGWVPVFWACGVTPQSIVMHSKPELAICHSPGKMLITDVRDVAYQVP
ncbi:MULTISPECIES: putative hydro-lyase [unclassified Corynebacterium]|uniref:putative hydro-lyase n=1 Tax=unclassified Corynebacterium TaxID=2624378 RepID=UPI001EF5260C|nr:MULTISPECIES: putative hydro-lyase [unclassified Corynebacterium]MCG7288560.1 putative hydro-lyase [Corynebacterium sp. ACRPZ]MCG7293134.1 putative hydro-lyase [Corynebacterium sp. ACRPY]